MIRRSGQREQSTAVSRPTPTAEEPWDALVVGAGPAGSVAAYLLARQGLRVLLADRARFPRAKPCGDCLSAAATALLDRLELLPRILETGPAWLRGWTITSPGRHACTGGFGDRRGLAVERRVLDAELRAAALEAGARPLVAQAIDLIPAEAASRVGGVVLRTPEGQRETRARLVVGADGLRSVVARRLDSIRRPPRLHKVSLTAHVRVAEQCVVGEMFVLDGGCIGFAPVGRGRANLTLVVDRDRASELGPLSPAEFMRPWIARVPRLEDRIAGLDDPGLEILASGPFDWPSRGAVQRGVALVGDAAGYYDPFTGQGVYQAMAGAEALADEVGPVLGAGGSPRELDAALQRYAAAYRRLTRPARRLQRVIESILSRQTLADAALQRLRRAPQVMDRLIEVTGDLRSPRSLLSPRLLSSLLIPSSPESQ